MMIERNLFSQIIDHIKEKEMTVIIGPRQVGKTTILNQIEKYLLNKKKVGLSNIFRFNLDVSVDRNLFSNQQKVINFINDRKKIGELMYFFIDEVQRIKEAGVFLKGIYDLDLRVKFLLTGSSSLEIKSKIQEALTGRKKIFNLMPLGIHEYLKFINPRLFDILSLNKNISDYDLVNWEKIIGDFAVFGGYPRVVLEKNINKKIELIEELYNSYLEKDIVGFLKIRKEAAFNKLVSLLAAQIGGLLNVDQLAAEIGAETETVKKHLEILENTFIIKMIKPFFTNAKKELIKMPKLYFVDNGIRNFAISRFEPFADRADKGELFENVVATELIKKVKLPDSLLYWRSLQKAEVDFVVRKGDGRLIPFEAKAQKLKKTQVSRSYHSFISQYSPKLSYLVNLSLRRDEKIKDTKLSAITIFDIKSVA